ncbi:hypothetical protein GH714_026180 [Hevea brasiliensis]|uniref:SMP-30/Gluconolactonase/LRE-like region domain-containing protein n=1 Tax=Hevea brasiliensis TaxID=3981 RepID=A0A6A6MKZ8_HEVBR|nr:hypothetical protein GH714_026180 [Hevea brasiliensis]
MSRSDYRVKLEAGPYHGPISIHISHRLGLLIKRLSSILKWTARSSSKTPQSDGNVLQFEDGYLVETIVEGNEIGVVPYKIRVSEDGELYAVDEVNSNIVKITPPFSQYSRARLVAGSFQGYTGHVDGKPNEARFNHPRGVTMDDKGNVYVADTLNLAIRKIGDAGVTTIAGGKSNIAGYRDGPSEDAKFSTDFDVIKWIQRPHPLKDSLRMPEDEVEPPTVQRQSIPVPLSETRQVHTPDTSDKYSEMKATKDQVIQFQDPSLSSKHRSSKRQEYAEFYGSGEVPPSGRPKSHKRENKHRQRDKSGEGLRQLRIIIDLPAAPYEEH